MGPPSFPPQPPMPPNLNAAMMYNMNRHPMQMQLPPMFMPPMSVPLGMPQMGMPPATSSVAGAPPTSIYAALSTQSNNETMQSILSSIGMDKQTVERSREKELEMEELRKRAANDRPSFEDYGIQQPNAMDSFRGFDDLQNFESSGSRAGTQQDRRGSSRSPRRARRDQGRR